MDGTLHPDFQHYPRRFIFACWTRIRLGQSANGDSHYRRHCYLRLGAATGINLIPFALAHFGKGHFPRLVGIAKV